MAYSTQSPPHHRPATQGTNLENVRCTPSIAGIEDINDISGIYIAVIEDISHWILHVRFHKLSLDTLKHLHSNGH